MESIFVLLYMLIPFFLIFGPTTNTILSFLPSMELGILYICILFSIFMAISFFRMKIYLPKSLINIFLLLISYFFVTYISTLLTGSASLKGLIVLIIKPMFIGMVLYLPGQFSSHFKKLDISKVNRYILWMISITVVIGFLQQKFPPVSNMIKTLYFVNMQFYEILLRSKRMFSTLGNPNHYALILNYGFLIILFSKFKRGYWKYILYFIFLIALLATKSRTGLIIYVILNSLYVVYRKKVKIVNVLIGTIGLSAMIFIGRDYIQALAKRLLAYHSTMNARFEIWSKVQEQIYSSPLFGMGKVPNIYMEGVGNIPVDNMYLSILYQNGLIGFCIFFLWILFIMIYLLKRKNDYAKIGLGYLIAIMIANLTGDFLFSPKIGMLFWWTLGLVSVIPDQDQPQGQDTELEENYGRGEGYCESLHSNEWSSTL